MYERVQKICSFLRKESKQENILNKEIIDKYKIFKDWLLENGALFNHNIEFPVIYSPISKIGCKSLENINENESFIMIPENTIINSKDLQYHDKFIGNIKEEISNKNLPFLYLALNLYLEKKNNNSFYKPYIDVIFIKEEIIYIDKNKIEELNEIYELIIQIETFSELKKEEFIECYFKVVSRAIKLNDDLALIPLIDLFYSDNSINLKYEIYDSENMVFKYTSLINNNSNLKLNLYMTKSKNLPFNKASYNKLIPFIVNDNDDEEEEDEGKLKEIKINKNDYFSVACSKNNNIMKNNIICNNTELCNKKLLKYKGFCLLYNKNDYLVLKIPFKRGDVLIDRYLENIFKENYETKNDDPINNDIKIKIYFNHISTDLLKYFRFIYFYETKKKAKDYFKYNFNLDIEINIIYSAIQFLENKYKYMEHHYSFEKDFDNLEKEIFDMKGMKDQLKINIIIFRLSQKIIIKNQINLLNYIMNIMKKYKINGYNNIFDYITKEKISNEYDTEENTKLKILRFIAYMSQSIDLNNI